MRRRTADPVVDRRETAGAVDAEGRGFDEIRVQRDADAIRFGSFLPFLLPFGRAEKRSTGTGDMD